MARGDGLEVKWRGNWRMEWVASTLHTTSKHGVAITTADVHTSTANSRMNWRPPADLNGLVRFGERRNLVSAHVPSHFIPISTNHTESFVTCAVLSSYWRMRGFTVFEKAMSFCAFILFLVISLISYHIFPPSLLFTNGIFPAHALVIIATRYRPDGPGIESRWGHVSPHQSRPVLRSTQPPIQWVPGLSSG